MVGFNTEQEAEDFLAAVDNNTDGATGEILLAERTPEKKVKLTKFKVRTAYLKDI